MTQILEQIFAGSQDSRKLAKEAAKATEVARTEAEETLRRMSEELKAYVQQKMSDRASKPS